MAERAPAPRGARRPAWYIKARYEGKSHPCPICKATGVARDMLKLASPDSRSIPIPCYHCQGTGDESAAKRRNIGGQRPLR